MPTVESYSETMRDADGSLLLDREGNPIIFTGQREVPDAPEVAAAHAKLLIQEANEAIRQQLDALDARYGVRAMTEALNGDRTRLDWLEAEKAALRAQFV